MIVVCEKFRLLEQSDGKFKINEYRKSLRKSVKIEDDYMKRSNANAKISGIYYELDKEATEARNAPKDEGQDESKVEKDMLLEKAKSLGLDVDGRMGVKKLKELINEKESE